MSTVRNPNIWFIETTFYGDSFCRKQGKLHYWAKKELKSSFLYIEIEPRCETDPVLATNYRPMFQINEHVCLSDIQLSCDVSETGKHNVNLNNLRHGVAMLLAR